MAKGLLADWKESGNTRGGNKVRIGGGPSVRECRRGWCIASRVIGRSSAGVQRGYRRRNVSREITTSFSSSGHALRNELRAIVAVPFFIKPEEQFILLDRTANEVAPVIAAERGFCVRSEGYW